MFEKGRRKLPYRHKPSIKYEQLHSSIHTENEDIIAVHSEAPV